MPDLECRVAKLEQSLECEMEDCKEFRVSMFKTLKEINDSLNDLKLQREKQMSFLGGISAVISVIAGVGAFIVNKYF